MLYFKHKDASVKYRIVIIFQFFVFFYMYHSLNIQLENAIEESELYYSNCSHQSNSLLAKLRIVWETKNKIQAFLQVKESAINMSKAQLKIKNGVINGLQEKMEKCQKALETCQKNQTCVEKTKPDDDDEKSKKLEAEILKLREKMKENEMEHNKTIDLMQKEMNEYREVIKQYSGGDAIKHYTHNDTAHFQRSHKADEPLSFDRGKIENHLPDKLMLGKELVENLKERKRAKEEQENVHPDDRKINDEIPDENEEDYKQH